MGRPACWFLVSRRIADGSEARSRRASFSETETALVCPNTRVQLQHYSVVPVYFISSGTIKTHSATGVFHFNGTVTLMAHRLPTSYFLP